ncbi:DUF2336 domain-containing protein [Labrys wisconsinensis]|uniref:Uncharacterized protein (DUF2336 family) n=1 Tax=Labrys wisconsinensis TaxID=425677 RepID=A0ABU0J653_9HYPH|nr:DUF2336 domain-containing protein [Labrys wisconsinensis]MDQ0469714.1 uncharacterized protein (DUF2336 family) [Labrys wisconsinensis]
MFDDQLPRLEGLFALSRVPGLDVRPTLLRVLTDLFVDAAHRSETDVARYTELAAHLVDQVDEDTRIAVAGKLGPCAFAPRLVLDKLLASEPEAAARIIEASPLLGRDDLWALTTDGGPVTDAAIARRVDLNGELVRLLVRKGYPLVADALASNPAAPIDRETIALLAAAAVEIPGLATRLATRRGVKAQWLAPLFLDLDAQARAAVIEAFRGAPHAARFATREAQIFAPQLVLDAVEAAAMSRRTGEVAATLQDLLDIGAETAERIVHDPSGEALALALTAIGMPGAQAERLLMFVNEEAGRSVLRLRALSLLMETVPRAAATRLMRMATASAGGRGRHEPIFAEPARERPATQQRLESETGRRKATGA